MLTKVFGFFGFLHLYYYTLSLHDSTFNLKKYYEIHHKEVDILLLFRSRVAAFIAGKFFNYLS